METQSKLRILIPAAVVVVLGAITAGWYFIQQSADRADREWVISMLPPPPEEGEMEGRLLYSIKGAFSQIEKGDDLVAATGRLAKIYQANGYLNEAIQTLDLLLQLEPDNPLWPHLLAFLLAGYGELEPALELWDRTMELDPEYLPTHLRRAEALLKLNRFEDAEAAFTIVKIKDIENPHAYHGLARVAIHREDYATAHQHLTKSMQYSRGTVGIQLTVTVLERLGQMERAAAVRGMARTLEGYSDIPDPWVLDLMNFCYDPHQLVSAAGTFAYAGNTEEAIKLAKQAIKYDPENAMAHFQLGNMYRSENFQEALSAFETACRLNPQLSDAWLFRALIYKDNGSVEQCDELLKQGLLHCPDSPALHLQWGEQLVEKGRLEEAIPILKRSIKLRPQEADAYLALARIYFRQSKLDLARDITQSALEAEAGNPMALSFMVVLGINQGNAEEAETWLKKMELQPRCTPEMRENLAGFFEQAFSRPPKL